MLQGPDSQSHVSPPDAKPPILNSFACLNNRRATLKGTVSYFQRWQRFDRVPIIACSVNRSDVRDRLRHLVDKGFYSWLHRRWKTSSRKFCVDPRHGVRKWNQPAFVLLELHAHSLAKH
jgi:hypothetical protein